MQEITKHDYYTAYGIIESMVGGLGPASDDELFALLMEKGYLFSEIDQDPEMFNWIADRALQHIDDNLHDDIRCFIPVPFDAFLRAPKHPELTRRILETINVSHLSYTMQNVQGSSLKNSSYYDVDSPISQYLGNSPSLLTTSKKPSTDPLLNMQPYDEGIVDFYLYWIQHGDYIPSNNKICELISLQIDEAKLGELLSHCQNFMDHDEFRMLAVDALNYLFCEKNEANYPDRYSFSSQSNIPNGTDDIYWRLALYKNTAAKIELISSWPGCDISNVNDEKVFTALTSKRLFDESITFYKSTTLNIIKNMSLINLLDDTMSADLDLLNMLDDTLPEGPLFLDEVSLDYITKERNRILHNLLNDPEIDVFDYNMIIPEDRTLIDVLSVRMSPDNKRLFEHKMFLKQSEQNIEVASQESDQASSAKPFMI